MRLHFTRNQVPSTYNPPRICWPSSDILKWSRYQSRIGSRFSRGSRAGRECLLSVAHYPPTSKGADADAQPPRGMFHVSRPSLPGSQHLSNPPQVTPLMTEPPQLFFPGTREWSDRQGFPLCPVFAAPLPFPEQPKPMFKLLPCANTHVRMDAREMLSRHHMSR